MFLIRTLLLSSLIFFTSCATPRDTPFVDRSDVQAFINKLVVQDHFDRQYLTELFSHVNLHVQEELPRLNFPLAARPWYIYERGFVTKERVAKGIQFWKTHQDLLEQVSQTYQVDPKMLVAIIGVESAYGVHKGKYSAFDMLTTIAFSYPRRGAFFKKELEQYLLLCRDQDWDPKAVLSSHDGGLGQPQFMPSSYRAYAVSFDHSKEIDLFNNEADVISSVANYFHLHGWQMHAPIAVPATVQAGRTLEADLLIKGNYQPKMTLAQFEKLGIAPQERGFSPEMKAALLRVETSPGEFAYWLVFNNFYVITRYNQSGLYALAVTELAGRIQEGVVPSLLREGEGGF